MRGQEEVPVSGPPSTVWEALCVLMFCLLGILRPFEAKGSGPKPSLMKLLARESTNQDITAIDTKS